VKVTLGVEEKKFGLLFPKSKWWVEGQLEFSPEELTIIREKGIDDGLVYDEVHHNLGDAVPRTLRDIMKHGISCSFNSLQEARAFEERLRKVILPAVKEFIMEYGTPLKGKQTFEL
jgi:hypothetical protein